MLKAVVLLHIFVETVVHILSVFLYVQKNSIYLKLKYVVT